MPGRAASPSRLPQPAVPHTAWQSLHATVYKGLSPTVLPGPGSRKALCCGWWEPGPREGKGPVPGGRDLGRRDLKRSETCEDPVPRSAQGLDPWSAGEVTLAIQASTFARAPHSATPTHSGVPTPILSCWLRRLQDITHAIPAPKEPHWRWGVAQTRKEIPLHQAGSGNARAEIPIQRAGLQSTLAERPWASPGPQFPLL